MKKTLLFISLFLLASTMAWGQCGAPVSFGYSAISNGFNGPANTNDVGGVAYVVGLGNPALGSGTDTGPYLPSCRAACMVSQPLADTCKNTAATCTGPLKFWTLFNTGNVYINGQTNQSPAWDACPLTSDNLTAILWENRNTGLGTHTVYVAGATAKYTAPRWNFQATTTPAAGAKAMWAVPSPTVNGTPTKVGNNWTFPLRITSPATPGTWADNAAFAKQWYDGTIAAPPSIIIGWDLYYQISGSAPTSENAAVGWVKLGAADPAVTVALDLTGGRNYTDYSAAVTWDGNTSLWFACRPVFADNFRPTMWNKTWSSAITGADFFGPVSQNSIQVGPTGSGVFASMNATAQGNAINVNWTSNVETGVTGYQVYSATATAGPYKATGASIAPLGNGHNYAMSFTMPGTKASGVAYVKVAANKTDSTQEWSAIKKVPYGTLASPKNE
jgi:hypothetical protein